MPRWCRPVGPRARFLSVTGTGVEPAKSRGSRPRRFSCLRTRSWRVRELHPAIQAYEARLSLRPPAACSSSCRPRYRTGQTGLMGASSAPAAPAMPFGCQAEREARASATGPASRSRPQGSAAQLTTEPRVTKGRFELPCLAARRSERRASSSCATWSSSAARAGIEPAFPA